MTEPSTPQDAVPAPEDTLHAQEQGPATGARHSGPKEGALPGPRDTNQPADIAPEGPSTAYEHRFGDRGAAATEHEHQVRESLAGPSRDDTAHKK